ncbi:MAG: hypothetical protein CMP65_01695 [Flavobacteriales bacterium]|nr:hypothetical protein [Flavobacteriales bacterium]
MYVDNLMATHILILAAGEGSRLRNDTPKQFLEISGLPMVFHSVKMFRQIIPDSIIHIALPKHYTSKWSDLCHKHKFKVSHNFYNGGNSRIETVFIGLNKINKGENIFTSSTIGIHDAARPFIKGGLIRKLLSSAKKYGSAVPYVTPNSALFQFPKNDKKSCSITNRNDYALIQTPQFFNFNQLFYSYSKVFSKFKTNDLSSIFLDDSSVYNYFKIHPKLQFIKGDYSNLKITTDADYFIADKLYEYTKKTK